MTLAPCTLGRKKLQDRKAYFLSRFRLLWAKKTLSESLMTLLLHSQHLQLVFSRQLGESASLILKPGGDSLWLVGYQDSSELTEMEPATTWDGVLPWLVRIAGWGVDLLAFWLRMARDCWPWMVLHFHSCSRGLKSSTSNSPILLVNIKWWSFHDEPWVKAYTLLHWNNDVYFQFYLVV